MPLHSTLAKLFGYTQTLAFCNTVTSLWPVVSRPFSLNGG
jgi:hypothetical protein